MAERSEYVDTADGMGRLRVERDINPLDRSGIYRITNTVSGRFYIGSAKTFRGRWACHRSDLRKGRHNNSHLQRAWIKYGPDAFVFSVVECVDDLSLLIAAEQRHIDANWNAGLYNLSPTAGNSLGTHHTPETRKRLSEMRMGAEPWNRGVTHTPEARRKISEAARGRAAWNKGKTGQAAWNKGQKTGPLSVDHRNKLSIAQRMRPPRTADASRKISETQAATWLVTFPDGHSEEIRNINAFCGDRGLSSSAFSSRGRTKGFRAVKLHDGGRTYKRGYTLDHRSDRETIPGIPEALSGMGGSLTSPPSTT